MKRVALLLVLLSFALLIGACARADFNQPGDIPTVENALTGQGLQVCAQRQLNWNKVPGVVEGYVYDVGLDCTNYSKTNPGSRIWVVQFADLGSRESVLRNIESGRRLLSPAMTWTLGPVAIVIDGPLSNATSAAVVQALQGAGAK